MASATEPRPDLTAAAVSTTDVEDPKAAGASVAQVDDVRGRITDDKQADHQKHHEHQAKGGLFPNICLFLAVTLLAASNSVLAWLLEKGPPYFMPCNILCVSNVIAAVTSWPIFYKDLKWRKVRALRWRDWAAIFAASMLRNVGGAYFEVAGIEMTNVPTFSIVEMLESVEFFLLALCFLKHERRNAWILGNLALVVLGVLVSLFEPAMEVGLAKGAPKGKGVLYLALSGINFALAELVGHLFLDAIPLGIYAMGRVLLGTLFFHLLAWAEGAGSEEGTTALENIYSAELWAYMSWYGLLFITATQFFWLTALKRCRPAVISRATAFMFLLNLLFGAAITRQYPTRAQYIGSAFILLSIGSGLLEAHRNEGAEEGEEGEGEEGEAAGSSEAADVAIKAEAGGVVAKGETGDKGRVDDERDERPVRAAQEAVLRGQRI